MNDIHSINYTTWYACNWIHIHSDWHVYAFNSWEIFKKDKTYYGEICNGSPKELLCVIFICMTGFAEAFWLDHFLASTQVVYEILSVRAAQISKSLLLPCRTRWPLNFSRAGPLLLASAGPAWVFLQGLWRGISVWDGMNTGFQSEMFLIWTIWPCHKITVKSKIYKLHWNLFD